MELWRKTWREGFAKVLSKEQLGYLYIGLKSDDDGLIQGATIAPPPLPCNDDYPCVGGCAVAYPGWKSGYATVGEVETHFAQSCFQADQRLGEPAGCRHFLNWFDDTPRDEMRRELLAEVELAMSR